MNEKELTELIEKGEDSFTEFKEEKVHKGVTNQDKEMLRVENISRNNSEPPLTVNIEKIKINKEIVLCIYISKGPERPYRTNRGVYYIRSSSGKRQVTREELLRLYQATRSRL